MSEISIIVKNTLERLYSGADADYLPDKEGAWVLGKHSGFAKDAIAHYRDNKLDRIVIDRFDGLEVCDGMAVVYRGIAPVGELDKHNLGVCWTMDKRKAYAYRSVPKDMRYMKLCALVDVKSINWSHTIQKQMVLHSHEKEIVMLKGSEVTVLWVENRRFTTCELLSKDHRMFKGRI